MDSIREVIHDFWPPAPQFTDKQYPDLTGKNVLITGTSAGIGYEVAKLLLAKNATVVFVNRNQAKTEEAVERLKHELIALDANLTSKTLDKRIITHYLDLADLKTIKSGIAGLETEISHLDITIFNAGIMHPPAGSLSAQGYESQFGVNVLGHHLLLKFIEPLILKVAEPRVIFLSSLAHRGSPANGGMSWDFKENDAVFSKLASSYGQSKAAAIYQAAVYGQMHSNVISLPVHPGLLHSELYRDLPWMIRKMALLLTSPPVYGAYTELFAALHPGITSNDSGRYIAPWGEFRPMRGDIEKGCTDGTAKKLWDYCDEAVSKFL